MSSKTIRAQKMRQVAHELGLVNTAHQNDEETDSIRIENCVGFSKVPIGLAGPVHITGPGVDNKLYAPLATYEPTLVASCSRGCKVFDNSGGIQFDVLGDGMSRAPVFVFQSLKHAIAFYRAVPTFQNEFSEWAQSTSRFAQLQELRAVIIGSHVHLFCSFYCGDAAGQNMVTKAANHACQLLCKTYAERFHIKDFFIEGQLASDKKPSWGNVRSPRGVQVVAWGTITPASCQSYLGCTTEQLAEIQRILKEGGIRNGQFGSNINTANIVAAMFVSTGQDIGSVAEASWSHLTTELDEKTKHLTVSLFFPSLTVGTVGGGTNYGTQKEALGMLGCMGPYKKHALAGIIASFALALDISTSAALGNNTFTDAHMRLARNEMQGKL
jgi:NADP-dependent 3-hydroxy-3-methylglutaryl-CoA reductase